MIDFVLSRKQQELKEGINAVGRYVIRPMSLKMDREGEMPEPFLRNFMRVARSFRGEEAMDDFSGTEKKPRDPSKPIETSRTAAVGAEELAWADAAMLLCLPGPGLGGPPRAVP
jgi:hypothetical protein